MSINPIYNVQSIATEIVEAYNDSSQPSYDKAYRAINRALRIISRYGNWPFFRDEDILINTVANQQYYKLKSNVKLPKYLHTRDPARKLVMVDLRTLRKLYPNNTQTTGAPLFWRVKTYNVYSQSYELGLWPIPDGVYALYLDADLNTRLAVTKNDDIRSTGIPEEMIETVIAIGTALMYEKSSDGDYGPKYAQAMEQLREDWDRLGQHPDDPLTSRVHMGRESYVYGDPQLPPRFSNE